MFRALMKKQLLSLLSFLYINRKDGTRRSGVALVGYVVLFGFFFLSMSTAFFGIAATMCKPFIAAGLDWFYFAFMALMTIAVGIMGSVFMSYSAIFGAKDNDLMLSLPIPPGMILFTRMISVWLMSLLFELMVFAPAVLCYLIEKGFSGRTLVFGILLLLLSSLLVLALSSLLGWLVAGAASKMRRKNLATMVLTLGFLGLYYFVYFKMDAIMNSIVANGEQIAGTIKRWIYPVYQFGLAGTGDVAALIKYALICIAAITLVYALIARSFISIATANRGAPGAEFKRDKLRASALGATLLKREFMHFISSPPYMLNCAFGTLTMPVAAVLLLIKADYVKAFTGIIDSRLPGAQDLIVPVCAIALCFACTMNDITAPSISIEGRTLWIAKSLPIAAEDFLFAKEKMHLLLTFIPAALLWATLSFTLNPGFAGSAAMLLATMAFILFSADLGLALNLNLPNLNWVNETAAVKSSLSALICIFGGGAAALLPGLVYYILHKGGISVGGVYYTLGMAVFFAMIALALRAYIKKCGPEKLEAL